MLCFLSLSHPLSLYQSMSLGTAAVWGGTNTNAALNWGSDGTSVWGESKPKAQPTGFWDDAVANNSAGLKSQK